MSLQAVRTFSKVTFGLFALLGVGVVAAEGGCGPGDTRYYCDSTGCFNCDGYGCSPVKPPVNNTCTGNKSCGAGEVCTTTGCVKQCPGGKDTECPQGTVCKANLCVAPTDPPPDPKQCTTKADCNSGEQCQGGKCVACGGSNGPCSCAVNTDCDAGQVCSGGICKSSSTVCKYSSECGAGKVCADGQCLVDCSKDAKVCAAGEICSPKGVCVLDKPECTTNTQCVGNANGPICVAGKCSAQCGGSLPACQNGFYCEQGACVVDNRPKPNCTVNGGECGPNQQCVGGFCKYTCSDDNQCKLIDARIGFCGKDKVCRSFDEANAECFANSDCTGANAGKSCVANKCL